MALKQRTDAEATQLANTTDARTGIKSPAADVDPWLAPYFRQLGRVVDLLVITAQLQVYEVEGNPDAVGVLPGRVTIDGTVVTYAGADPAIDGLTNNDTTYIWITSAGAIGSAVDGTGWPGTSHIKLAEVTLVDGEITGIVDHRHEYLLSNASALTLPLPITSGGTGANSAATARTALGLVIGTNVQAFHANLSALAGLTGAADRMAYFTGAGALSLATLTTFARTLLDDVDAATARATLGTGGIAAADADTAALTDSSGGTSGVGTVGAIGVTITDPSDTPADADGLRDDLVTNTIPSIEAELVNLRNAVATLAAYSNTLKDEVNDLRAKMRTAGQLAV